MDARWPLLLGSLALLASVACTSPEAQRTRAGGPGADVGNRRSVVQMHEGSRPFYGTPRLQAYGQPSLDPAQQADKLSRR